MRAWRVPVRLGAVLICLTGYGLLAAAPAVAAPGFDTALTELPGRFTPGDRPATVTAVVSKQSGNANDCLKVRWSMVVRVEGLRLDQVGVDRIEDSGSFPFEVRIEGDAARLTDRQFDPGTLCRNQTVTARYQIAVAKEVTDGKITLEVQALDERSRVLARQSASREVISERAQPPAATAAPSAAPSPTESVEPAPTEEPSAEATVGPAAGTGGGTGRADRASASGGIGAVQIAFLIGGLLVFLGAGLLLRLRRLVKPVDEVAAVAAGAPPSWMQAPPRRGRRGTARMRR
ncbi:hypothetical protein [Micromonospora zhanjiangensis]|uniref:Uncharacterized protein n=1 Tax=Micromonospora zhanjiangensis TaxID=1522057 RepID=A0ABV8KHA4_9ACTN